MNTSVCKLLTALTRGEQVPFEDSCKNLPVDEGAFPSRVVTHQQDGDLFPGRKQLHTNGFCYRDQSWGNNKNYLISCTNYSTLRTDFKSQIRQSGAISLLKRRKSWYWYLLLLQSKKIYLLRLYKFLCSLREPP